MSPGASLPAGTTVHCQPSPAARTGFVFICPGRHEANRGYPCAAGTGANLNRVLAVLHERRPDLFPSADRSKYVITNSWDRVEYPALTGRSVPTEDEVLAPDNLARLAAEIARLDHVVACGAQARAAVQALVAAGRLRARTAYGRHLSQRSVNMIAGAADTPGRIARWCDDLLAQWG
jgi:uracil-DNA glycosylase